MARKKSGVRVAPPGNSTTRPTTPPAHNGDRTPLEPLLADAATVTLRKAIARYMQLRPGTPPAAALEVVLTSVAFAPVVAVALDPATVPVRWLIEKMRQGDPVARRIADQLCLELTPK